MKALRNHLGRNILIAIVFLAAAVVLGEVAWPGTAPVTALATGGTGSTPTPTPAPSSFFDIFLDIPGIPGESTAVGHVGSIEVSSWSWGVTQTLTTVAGNVVVRGPLTGQVTIVKQIDKATPLLFTKCNAGQTIPLITVQLVRFDGQTYMRYDLKNVLITAIAHGDVNGDGVPDEKISLDLGGGTLTYTQFDATGKSIGQTTAQW
jgi:type VI secretion system secreted protein Hcp